MIDTIPPVVRLLAVHSVLRQMGVPSDPVAETTLEEAVTDPSLDIEELAALVLTFVEEHSREVDHPPGLRLVVNAPDQDQAPRYTLGPPRHRRTSSGWTVTRLRGARSVARRSLPSGSSTAGGLHA